MLSFVTIVRSVRVIHVKPEGVTSPPVPARVKGKTVLSYSYNYHVKTINDIAVVMRTFACPHAGSNCNFANKTLRNRE